MFEFIGWGIIVVALYCIADLLNDIKSELKRLNGVSK